MPLAAWPAIRHKPMDSDAALLEPHVPPVVTEVEDGPELMRVQSQTLIRKLAYRIPFSEADYATFLAFAETTLQQGTAHFTMSVAIDGGAFVTRRCYLQGGMWNAQRYARGWMVSFTLCAFVAPLS